MPKKKPRIPSIFPGGMHPPGKKYKILVISDYRPVVSARPEAEIFIRLASRGHEIHIITFPDAHDYITRFREAGLIVWDTHPEKKWSRTSIRYLRHLIREQQYDIVHAFNTPALMNAIWALQGLPAVLIAYRGYAGQTHWYDPVMYLKYFHPRVDYIWCVSRDIQDILARNMPWGKHKLVSIPKGHDPVWYAGVQPADRSQLGFVETDILVSFVANLRPFKGFSYLLQATHLLPQDPRLHFLFIGQGYDQPGVREQIGNSPYKNQIHLLGYRTDAASLVAASDCLILTSTHGEGLAKSVVEAMSLGIPPILTAIPGNEGLVEDGVSGWIIPPKDPDAIARALVQMASDEPERKRRGIHARLHIQQHFHIDLTVEAFEKWYSKISPNK